MKKLLLKGPAGLRGRKPGGRKPKLTKKQRRDLKDIILKGPAEGGFSGACWRSPMIQDLIQEKYGVFHSVNYISQLIKNMKHNRPPNNYLKIYGRSGEFYE